AKDDKDIRLLRFLSEGVRGRKSQRDRQQHCADEFCFHFLVCIGFFDSKKFSPREVWFCFQTKSSSSFLLVLVLESCGVKPGARTMDENDNEDEREDNAIG